MLLRCYSQTKYPFCSPEQKS